VAEIRIAAESRTEFGKGGARRTRRAGNVPAVVYGHGRQPVHISLPSHELMRALRTPNILLSLDLGGQSELVLPKAVQRDPIKGLLEHVDLVLVRRGEKVTVEIAVTLIGEAAPETLVDQQLMTVSVEAEATHIPTGVEVSIDGLTVGHHVTAGDITLPAGSSLITESDHVVVQGLAAPTAEQVDAELAEAEADAGIEREPTDEEQAAQAATEDGDSDDAGGENAPAAAAADS